MYELHATIIPSVYKASAKLCEKSIQKVHTVQEEHTEHTGGAHSTGVAHRTRHTEHTGGLYTDHTGGENTMLCMQATSMLSMCATFQHQASTPREISVDAMSAIERFIVLQYDCSSTCSNVNLARKKMFAMKG